MADTEQSEVVALGHAGSGHYAGIGDVPEPGRLAGGSDERRAGRRLPDHRKPDFYEAKIAYSPAGLCIESKSLKLDLAQFRNEGAFCEALAVQIRDEAAAALELGAGAERVTLRQKARGGITNVASA